MSRTAVYTASGSIEPVFKGLSGSGLSFGDLWRFACDGAGMRRAAVTWKRVPGTCRVVETLRTGNPSMTLNRATAGRANAGWPCGCGCAERVPRYPTDLTDRQWAVLEPLLPAMLCDTPLGGRPEKHWRRTMIDAMFYICDNGCKWRALPADFPPWQTVHAMLARWKRDGVWADIAD